MALFHNFGLFLFIGIPILILIDKYKDIAYNLALSIVKNKEGAKDITQDSLLKVLEKIGSFRNDAKFSTWLYRIVYNRSVGFVKAANRANGPDYVLLFDDTDNCEDPEDRIKELYQAINSLDDTDRHVIMLFYLAEKPIKEIARITGFSIANVKVILHRARKKLYEKMNNENK